MANTYGVVCLLVSVQRGTCTGEAISEALTSALGGMRLHTECGAVIGIHDATQPVQVGSNAPAYTEQQAFYEGEEGYGFAGGSWQAE